ncbi:MAG: Asp-tRNA(Asn)/Glu-tRNA(Gln) amidotransferase subunit GatC [Candidatus Brennerbacteria bacterium]|nr:Asp-tRNA(Asn)/Glu-tRNA(Gln) amidotransferase subunit GatC [Candidatus Brennerbacteria bacterium]
MLSEKNLENLAELSRIRLAKGEEKKFLDDLEKILAYVAELNEVKTDGVFPMAASPVDMLRPRGSATLTNAIRANDGGVPLAGDIAREAFPESENGFLKVPPVFE